MSENHVWTDGTINLRSHDALRHEAAIHSLLVVLPIGVFCLLVPVVVNNGPKVLLPLLSVIVAAAIGSIAHMILVYTPGPATEKEWAETYPLEKEALDYFII